MFAFELTTRLMYYSGFLALGAWFFWLLRKRIAACGIPWPEAMLVSFVGVLAVSHHVHQQPEEIAVLLTLGLTAFSLSDSRALNCLSGLFLPLMFTCKAVTIGPAAIPFLLVLATRERGRILRVGASWAAFAAAGAAFFILALPQEIADMRMAATIQPEFHLDPRDLRNFVRNGVWSFAHIPFFLVAAVCVGWLLFRAAERKEWKDALLALGVIAVSAPPVLVQGLHFPYHYFLFFPAAFFVALWTVRLIPDAGRRGRVWFGMACLTLGGWLLCAAFAVQDSAYLWLWVKGIRHYDATMLDLDRRFHLNDEPKMLFLEPTNVNFVIRTEFYAPRPGVLPLHQGGHDERMRNTPYFRKALADALCLPRELHPRFGLVPHGLRPPVAGQAENGV